MQTSNQKRVAKLELVERRRLFSEYNAALRLLTVDELQSLITLTGGPDFSEMSDTELEEFANAEIILPSLGDIRRQIAELALWQASRGSKKNGEKWTG